MKFIHAFACAALAVSISACGGEDAVMPDLSAKRLDIALSDLERAGYDDEPEVLGGGMFGVVDESNWTVCDQEPAPGEVVDSTPRLTVDRTCEELDDLEGESATQVPQTAENESPSRDASETTKQKKEKRQAATVADTFVMPAVVGANLQDAQDLLQSLGSYLLTQNDATGQERFQVLDSGWKVCAQFPAAGTVTPLSRLVDLRVVKLDETCP